MSKYIEKEEETKMINMDFSFEEKVEFFRNVLMTDIEKLIWIKDLEESMLTKILEGTDNNVKKIASLIKARSKDNG